MERASGSRGIDRDRLQAVFQDVRQGWSLDRVLADPDLNDAFVKKCHEVGLLFPPEALNRSLLNLRKAGELSGLDSKRTNFEDEEYRFAAEIAIRIIERRDQVTLDDVLCNPQRAKEFDRLANELAPGFAPVQYRWSALSLRKSRDLKPEVAVRLLPPEEVRLVRLAELKPESLPKQPGVYAFIDMESKRTLYVGEASNLRTRLGTHHEHSDNKYLARHLWEHGMERIAVEFYVLPEGTSKRDLRAIEVEQIRHRNPPFNISGRLGLSGHDQEPER